MKNDDELLTLVAIAIGLDRGDDNEDWNPLDDDGDALRVAVRLGIVPEFDHDQMHVSAFSVQTLNDNFDEPLGKDPYAATRRAIVRAAAAIGESVSA